MKIERAETREDWLAIRKICCLTGKPGGNPIEGDRRAFFGELWIRPFEKLAPRWAWVLRNGGEVSGYIVATPDARLFRRQRWRVDFPLLFEIVSGEFPKNADTRAFWKRTVKLMKSPESYFANSNWIKIHLRFPAELHINLLPEFRAGGKGGALIDTLLAALRDHGIPGVHCICGEGPRAFYEKQGFEMIERAVVGEGVAIYLMAKSVSVS